VTLVKMTPELSDVWAAKVCGDARMVR